LNPLGRPAYREDTVPTRVHIPRPILEAVDRRARRLKMSRNRFIVRALEREISDETHWSPGFFERLAETRPEDAATVDEMLDAITQMRTRKR
jgi:Ribbon-helix-helix protein, copG family